MSVCNIFNAAIPVPPGFDEYHNSGDDFWRSDLTWAEIDEMIEAKESKNSWHYRSTYTEAAKLETPFYVALMSEPKKPEPKKKLIINPEPIVVILPSDSPTDSNTEESESETTESDESQKKKKRRRRKKNKHSDEGWTTVEHKKKSPKSSPSSSPSISPPSPQPEQKKFINTTLILKNLPYHNTYTDDLMSLMEQYGTITMLNILRNPDGTCKGVAFVRFLTKESSDKALAAGDFWCDGRKVYVEYAKDRRESEN